MLLLRPHECNLLVLEHEYWLGSWWRLAWCNVFFRACGIKILVSKLYLPQIQIHTSHLYSNQKPLLRVMLLNFLFIGQFSSEHHLDPSIGRVFCYSCSLHYLQYMLIFHWPRNTRNGKWFSHTHWGPDLGKVMWHVFKRYLRFKEQLAVNYVKIAGIFGLKQFHRN